MICYSYVVIARANQVIFFLLARSYGLDWAAGHPGVDGVLTMPGGEKRALSTTSASLFLRLSLLAAQSATGVYFLDIAAAATT